MSVCSLAVCVWQLGKGGRRYQFTQKHIFCGRLNEYLLTNKWGNQALGQSMKHAENKRAVSCRKYIAQNAKELGAVLTTSGYLSPSKSDRHQHSPDNLQNLYLPLRMKRRLQQRCCRRAPCPWLWTPSCCSSTAVVSSLPSWAAARQT